MCLVPTRYITFLKTWLYTFYHYCSSYRLRPQNIFLQRNHPAPPYVCQSVFIFAKRYAKQYTTARCGWDGKTSPHSPAHIHIYTALGGRKPHIFESQNRKAYRYKLCFRRAVYEQALKGIISNLLSQSVYSKFCQEDESIFAYVSCVLLSSSSRIKSVYVRLMRLK